MMLKNASNKGGANSVTDAPWHTKSRPRMLAASKAVFLENYLAVSTWILNRSSTECHEKKQLLSVYLVFDLEAGRFKFLSENLHRTEAVEKELSTLLITYSNSQRETHQIAQIRPFEQQKFCNE